MIWVQPVATIPQSTRPARTAIESHLPSLDGMRAVSILLVLVAHGTDAVGRESMFFFSLGQIGVSIFFVISGLLITWLMLRERDATGEFSLRNFYIRRFLRILPVFWLLIATVTALKMAHAISIGWPDIARALTFTHNYPLSLVPPKDYSYWLMHTWSLSLEEQFYLIWPSLFAILQRKHAARLAALLAVSGSPLYLLNHHFFPSLREVHATAFHTRVDILMAGCAAAFLLDSPKYRARIRKIPVWQTLAASSFFLFFLDPLLANRFPNHSLANGIVRMTFPSLEAWTIALALLVLVAGTPGVVFQAVNARVSRHIGKLSYSIYIWQQLFLAPRSAMHLVSWAWRLPALSLVSYASFHFVERPFIKLRGKFRKGVAV